MVIRLLRQCKCSMESDQDKQGRCHGKTNMESNQSFANKEGYIGGHHGNKTKTEREVG